MIRRSGLSGVVLLALIVVTSGCVSALGDPPEVEQLVGQGEGTGGASRDATALRDEAAALLQRLQDAAAVDRARRLFLEAAALDPTCFECYIGASRATAWLIEHEEDGERREDLAVEGVQIGQLCGRAFPDNPECRYRLALAVGQQARERPSTGSDGVDVMVELLEQLITEAPELDSAGPYRVLALVLLRAPGWPSGPGDPEYGLANARAAVDLYPDYAPNQLVLGEALAENDEPAEGRRAFERAVELATRLDDNEHPEAGEWRDEGMQALADME